MPTIVNLGELPRASGPACIHLRSKSMYVHGTLGETDHPSDSGSGACWCNTTQNSLGPDRDHVTRTSCVSGRDCYRETYQ